MADSGRGPTKAQALSHDCAKAGCYRPDGSLSWPASRVHMLRDDVTRRELDVRLMDNLDRKGVIRYAFLGLTAKDLTNLETLTEGGGGTKNYALLIRRLVEREAKALEASRQQTLDFG